jgi:glycosyltransferase involved in cell wall biosynthesis
LRILHVITDTNIGGAGRYLLNLLKQPAFGDFDVLIACPDGELAERIDARKWKRINISGRDVSFSLKLVPELMKIIKKEKADVVHTHSSLSARIAARTLGVPVVYTKHGMVRIPNAKGVIPGRTGPFKRSFNRLFAKMFSQKVIGVSQAICDELIESGIPEDMVVAIPNGIDLEEFKMTLREDSVRSKGPLVGTVARLDRSKALDVFLESAKIIVSSEPSTRFVIGGTGPLETELKDKIKQLRLEGFVNMVGFVDDVPSFLNSLDVYVLSSDYEGLGLAILEAMACGLPVVATNVGGVPEVVLDGETGFLVPPRQPRTMAQAIVRLLVDSDLAKTMGKVGRSRVEEVFDAKVMAEKTARVYRDLNCAE